MSAKPGITATVPGVQLQVANDFSSSAQTITDPTGAASALQLSTNSAIITSGSQLGIGQAPQYPLHVASGDTIRFELGTNTSMVSLGAPGAFNVDKVNVPAGRFTVQNSGNVGINQANPQFMLDVNGDINSTGTVHAAGLTFSGQLAVPGMQGESHAPNPQNLQLVFVDPSTGILYYHD